MRVAASTVKRSRVDLLRRGWIFAMRPVISIAVFALLLVVLPAAAARDADIRDEITDLRREFRVRVHYEYDEALYFPDGSHMAARGASATELSPDEVRRALPMVRIFLASYPERILRRFLSDVYLFNDFQYADGRWGGTYYKNSIYINCRARQKYMLKTMFHELSSVLMKRYPFPTREWQKINGRESRYIGAHHFADGRNYGSATSRQGLELGFITNYAASSLENDFNEISEWLFVQHYELRQLARDYPKIAAKADLAKAFYKRIDDDFEFRDRARL